MCRREALRKCMQVEKAADTAALGWHDGDNYQ